jgi:hypothetical protein
MIQHLRLRVPRYDLDLDIELLSDMAPNMAAALASSVPYTGLVNVETSYSSVIVMRLPNFPRPLQRENATGFPIPGDVLLFEQDYGVDLVVYHQRAGLPYNETGYITGNRVGFVTNLTTEAKEGCRRVWSEGSAWGALGTADTNVIKSVRDDRPAAAAEIELRRQAWQRRTRRDHIGPEPSGGRRVALIIPEYNVRTIVELSEQRAPHAADNTWNNLPVDTTLMHGRASGAEMFTEVGDKWHWAPKYESKILYPIPGDMVYYFGPAPRIQINYFYGRGSIPAGIPNPEVGNLVGWSVGDFSAFADGCYRISFEGWKTLVVERVE